MIVPCDTVGISAAVEAVKNGRVIIFPTDTVYGIGCDPFNVEAVKTVYRIKGREESKRFPVLGYSISEISEIAVLDGLSRRLASKFWPGPLTLILPVREGRITASLGLDDKIAVRVPDHPCTLELLKHCKVLVGTSANRSGGKPATNPSDIAGKLDGFDILLDGGNIPDPSESTIVEVVAGRVHILRRGKIDEQEIMSQA